MKKIILIVLVAVTLNSKSQTCFITTNYTIGSFPTNSTTIVSADFNNDGKLDIIAAHYASTDMNLFLGDGLGGFAAPSILSADTAGGSTTGGIRCLISSDFNSDGKADLAMILYGSPGFVKILFGNGQGGFPTNNAFMVGNAPFSICTADFNNDTKSDLAVANSDGGTVSVLLGDGFGNFPSNIAFYLGNGPIAVTSGDFNGDSKIDLAVAKNGNGGGSDSVAIVLGDGAGGFGAAAMYLAGVGPYAVCSKDFNADGFADVAVANTNSNTISVFLSQGMSGLFNSAIDYAAGGQPFSVVSSDFNADGNFDLAVADHGGNSVSLLLGTGTGSFGTASSFSAYAGPWTIISADFNSDGKPDIATANHDYNFISVLLNVIPTNCVGCALNSAVAVPDICIVTTDSATDYNYNVIYWDKTQYTNVDSFIVYRKDAISSNYLRIGAVSNDSLSEFTDTCFTIGGPNGGNPQYSSWLYKLAIRDTCGNVGAMSPFHQSMFVQGSGANFSWNAYTIENGQTNPITGYSFLRDDNNSGNWHILVNTVGLTTTDPNYASFPNANWRIDALGFSCTPTRAEDIRTKSHSNTIGQIAAGISKPQKQNFQIVVYPNPAYTSLTVENIKQKTIVRLYDSVGNLTIEKEIENNVTLDVSHLTQGVYTLVAENDKGRSFNKVIIAK